MLNDSLFDWSWLLLEENVDDLIAGRGNVACALKTREMWTTGEQNEREKPFKAGGDW